MSILCCDSSFLFSLYGNDVHTGNALGLVQRAGQPLMISVLNEYELGNALRFAEYRKAIPTGKASQYLADFEADMASGRLVMGICNLADVITEAKRLSMHYTVKGGHRSFDILHVAAALLLGGTDFLSFDANQQRLASAAGLRTP
jgi:predicted nucleic acid-binding protein